MSCPKAAFFALFAVMSFSASGFATPYPATGDYDIDSISAAALIFNPVPWASSGGANAAYFYPYATEDYSKGYSGSGDLGHNLARVYLSDGGYSFSDYGQISGDLAIRYGNYSGSEITFLETVVTIDFKSGRMDISLPGFNLASNENMHFWVAGDGSTYFANITDGAGSAGGPNMSAMDSIAGGYIAAVAAPEPAALTLLGLGGIFLRRRK